MATIQNRGQLPQTLKGTVSFRSPATSGACGFGTWLSDLSTERLRSTEAALCKLTRPALSVRTARLNPTLLQAAFGQKLPIAKGSFAEAGSWVTRQPGGRSRQYIGDVMSGFHVGRRTATTRLLPSVALGFLVFEVLLQSLGEQRAFLLVLSTVLGLAGGLYLSSEWRGGRLSSTSLVVWSAALPFCMALLGLYVAANMR